MEKLRSTIYRRWYAIASILILLIASAGLYAYTIVRSCEVDAVQEASAILVSQMNRYDNVYIPATAGTRTSLDYPLTVMQQILLDTQQVAVPACMGKVKMDLIGYMETVIHAFGAYQAGEPDAAIQGLLDDSYDHVRAFRLELETVNECAPFCWP